MGRLVPPPPMRGLDKPRVSVKIAHSGGAHASAAWVATALSKMLSDNGVDSGIATSVVVPTIDKLPNGRLPIPPGTRVEIELS